MLNYFTLLFNWWSNATNSLLPGNENRIYRYIINIITIWTLVNSAAHVLSYLTYLGPQQYTTKLDIFITMGSSVLIYFPLKLFYLKTGQSIIHTCFGLTARLTHHYGLESNLPSDALDDRETILASLFCILGVPIGAISNGIVMSSILYRLGANVPAVIMGFDVSGPALLTGGISGAILGFTTGRLVHHSIDSITKIFEKRRSVQQARAIITLNDLPCNLKKNRYLPPEILGIIHSHLIKSSEKDSFDIINHVIKEANNNCSIMKNKFGFFVFPLYLRVNNSLIISRFVRENLRSRVTAEAPEISDIAFVDMELGLSNGMTRYRFLSIYGQQNKSSIKYTEEESQLISSSYHCD